MKGLILILVLLSFTLSSVAQTIYFDKTYDYQNELDASTSVVITDDGGYLTAGQIMSSTYRGLYFVRTDSFGDTIWTKRYKEDSSAYYSGMTSLIHTIDGNYAMAGSFLKDITSTNSDALLVKLNDSGDTLWTKTYGGIYWDAFDDCLQNTDGTYMLAGATEKFSNGNNVDFYLVKTDNAGNLIWEKNYGGNADDRVYSLDHTPDGGYILAGYTFSFSVGLNDAYLVKVDSNGNQQWQKTYGYSQNDAGWVKTTKDGGYLFYGGNDIPSYWEGEAFIQRLDSAGNTIWNKSYGYSIQYADYFSEAIEMDDGSFVLAGITIDSVPPYDVYGWIMKVNANGDSLWSRRYKRDSHSYFLDLKETQDKGFVVAGWAWVVNGGQSAWLMKLDSMGCVTPNCFPIGVEEQTTIGNEQLTIKVYPNPATSTFTISGNYQLPSVVELYDITGRQVIQQVLTSNRQPVDIDDLSKGIYLWKLDSVSGKIVIE